MISRFSQLRQFFSRNKEEPHITEHRELLLAGAEIPPPWVVYPHAETWWGGWRQGTSEYWLYDIWLPFWRGLDVNAKEAYLAKWNVTDEWRENLSARE